MNTKEPFLVSEELFDILQQRSIDALRSPEKIDDTMVSLIRIFNVIPDVTTVWCCGAHPEKDDDDDDDDWYLVAVARSVEGFLKLMRIGAATALELNDPTTLKFTCEVNTLNDIFLHDDDKSCYPVVTFAATVESDMERKYIHSVIEDVILG